MVDLTFTNDSSKKTYSRKFFLNIIEKAVNEFKLHKDIGLSVNLVGKAKIQVLNKKHRKKNKTTDVLSFPLLKSNSHKEGKKERMDVMIELGDIFICPDVVVEKVKKEIYPVRDREGSQRGIISYGMAWVTVHGLLHLLGYDHERSKSEEKKMFALQDKILRSL